MDIQYHIAELPAIGTTNIWLWVDGSAIGYGHIDDILP